MTRMYKDPNARKDFHIDLSEWLDTGDTITAATWSVVTAGTLAIDESSHTDTVATVWLVGGDSDSSYFVKCHFTTAQGRQDDHSILIVCREQ